MQALNHQEVEETNEIDLLELLFALLGHWKSIVVTTIIAGIIAFCLSNYFMTPLYESTSALYVVAKNSENTSLSDLQIGSNLTNDYMDVIVGRQVLETVIKDVGLNEKYASLHNRVNLKNPTSSRIIKITVTDIDPARAKATTDMIATVASDFITEKMKQESPSVIQWGEVAERPVSPNVNKNSVIGAAIGFMLASAVIIIAQLLNNTIMTPEDVEKKLGLNVLASLPIVQEEYDGSKKSQKKKRSTKKEEKSVYGAIVGTDHTDTNDKKSKKSKKKGR